MKSKKYGTNQLCLEGPTDRNVQIISKLDREHCKMLVGLLTRHINLQYVLHKMRRARTPSCRRCGAEKETSIYIQRKCPVLKKVRMQSLGPARMDPEQIKKVKLSEIVALGKGAGIACGPESWSPNGTHPAKKFQFESTSVAENGMVCVIVVVCCCGSPYLQNDSRKIQGAVRTYWPCYSEGYLYANGFTHKDQVS